MFGGLAALALFISQPAAYGLPAATIGRPALISPTAAEAAFPTSLDGNHTSTLGTNAPPPNEVVELARVPNTTDVLGAYVVTLAPDGELIGYRRQRRYNRSQADED